MKFKTFPILIVLALAVSLAFCPPAAAQNITVTNPVTGSVTVYAPVTASTNPPAVSGWVDTIKLIGSDLGSATNYDAEVYGTYAPGAAGKTKEGFGSLLIYDVSSHVGAAVGVDYLGQFSLVSGNVTFKLPLQPLAGWGFTNFWMTPNAITGIGTPLGGAGTANGTVTTIVGVGDTITFGHLWGGVFNLGGEAVNLSNAGAYSGWDYRLLFGWSKGF